MAADCDFPRLLIDRIRREPVHQVLNDLARAALEHHLLRRPEFKRLIAYLLEYADGRDRRDPVTVRGGEPRPTPKLRIVIEQCFGAYADLSWFRLCKIVHDAQLPLAGLFSRIAARLARVSSRDFGDVVEALLGAAPDTALLRLLHRSGGKLPRLGVQLFSEIAYAFRRDQYFLITPAWADESGCVRFIGDDLRKYCALCRTMRAVCDERRISPDIRTSVFDEAMRAQPVDPALLAAVNRAIGSTLGWATVLDPGDGYVPTGDEDAQTTLPLAFASKAILARRGSRDLRRTLCHAYGDRCAMTGPCPADVLEVAYILPFPPRHVNSSDNALLLRCDLHTLWDLNLIGVNPQDLRIAVARKLRGSAYEDLDGQRLLPRSDHTRLNAAALEERWAAFVRSQPVEEPVAAPREGQPDGAAGPVPAVSPAP